MVLEVRHATLEDMDDIMICVEEAIKYMRANGNFAQWGNGYPSRELIADDIANKNHYMVVDPEVGTVGTFCFIIGEDPTYKIIDNGAWLNDETYGVIHRLASNGKVRGVGLACFDFAFSKVPNLRVDTHDHNKPMIKLLEETLGFTRVGVIYVRDGTPRHAFHKVIAS